MNEKYQAWRATAIGRGMNPDGVYNNQCVDVPKDWAINLWPGKHWTETVGYGNAKDMFNNMPGSYWTKIVNNPSDANQLPTAGDVIVWNAWSGNPYGHVAVVTSATSSNVTIVQQDGFNEYKPATEVTVSWNKWPCIGWLKPKVNLSTAPAGLQPYQRKVENSTGVNGRAEPNTSSVIIKEFAQGEILDFAGWIKGQNVNGIDTWFKGKYSETFYWAGAFEDKSTNGLPEIIKEVTPVTPPPVVTPPVNPQPVDNPDIIDITASDIPTWIRYDEVADPDDKATTNQEAKDYYKVAYKPIELHTHWWGSPNTGSTHDGTVAHLKNTTDLSVNFVLSENRITKMVRLTTLAYTTGQRNPYGWKIETDPKLTEGVYKTLGALTYIVEKKNPRLANEPIRLHKEFMSTACLPLDSTELLTRDGWVSLADITIEDKVASWSDGIIVFDKVNSIVEPKVQEVYKARWLEATADHDVLMYTPQHNRAKPATRKYKYSEWLDRRRPQVVETIGQYRANGLDISDALLAMAVWVQADACYKYNKPKQDGSRSFSRISFNLKKQRKVDVVIGLLEELGWDYSHYHSAAGTQIIDISGAEKLELVETLLEDKKFTWKLLEMNEHQVEIFKTNLLLADGCVANTSYSSKNLVNHDIVQAVLALNKVSSHIYKGGDYPRTFFSAKTFGLSAQTKVAKRVTAVSCVSVDSQNILVRQHGKTFFIGNCSEIDVAKVRAYANKFVSGELDINTGNTKETPVVVPPVVTPTTPPVVPPTEALSSAARFVARVATQFAAAQVIVKGLCELAKQYDLCNLTSKQEGIAVIVATVLIIFGAQVAYKMNKSWKWIF